MKFAVVVLLFGVVCHCTNGFIIENESRRFGEEVEIDESRPHFHNAEIIERPHCHNAEIIERPHFHNAEIIEQIPHRHLLKENIVNRNPEVVFHQPPTLVYKKEPTYIKINHSPVYVKSSPVVYQRDGDQIRQPLFQKSLPRKVHVQKNHVKIIRPKEERVYVKNQEAPAHLVVEEFARRDLGNREVIREEVFPGQERIERFEKFE